MLSIFSFTFINLKEAYPVPHFTNVMVIDFSPQDVFDGDYSVIYHRAA